jgi:hypothetical protein
MISSSPPIKEGPLPIIQQHLKRERAPHKSFIPKGLGLSSYLKLRERDVREEIGEEPGLSMSPRLVPQ